MLILTLIKKKKKLTASKRKAQEKKELQNFDVDCHESTGSWAKMHGIGLLNGH